MQLARPDVLNPCIRLGDYQGDPPPPAHVRQYYFLPWQSKNVTNYQIPALANGVESPDRFFTASLMGCSVFFAGPEDSPTVYHAGVEGKIEEDNLPDGCGEDIQDARTNDEYVLLWRRVIRYLGVEPDAEVNKDQYGAESKRLKAFLRRMRFALERRGQSTEELDQYGAGKGCVMGVRDGEGNWTFYGQEIVFLYYESTAGNTIKVSVPTRVWQVYPVVDPPTIWDGLAQLLPDNIDDNDILLP